MRDFRRDSLFYWSKNGSLFKSLSLKRVSMRDFWRDSLFCFNKKGSLFKSLSHRCSSFLSENLKSINEIVRESNKKWERLVIRNSTNVQNWWWGENYLDENIPCFNRFECEAINFIVEDAPIFFITILTIISRGR